MKGEKSENSYTQGSEKSVAQICPCRPFLQIPVVVYWRNVDKQLQSLLKFLGEHLTPRK